jgi:hypothetical protein
MIINTKNTNSSNWELAANEGMAEIPTPPHSRGGEIVKNTYD